MSNEEIMIDKTKNFLGEFPAEGLLGMGGFLFYELGCVFVYDDLTLPTLRLHADGFGDDFDADSSEMIGSFTKVPADLVGECTYSLITIDLEEGVIELTIKKEGVVVGVFTGDSEGLGEAILRDRKGTLSIADTKPKKNKIIFEGQDGIETISFSYGNQYSITPGQPWGEVDTTPSNNGSKLTIDVHAGRKNSTTPADWFNASVNSDPLKMFHSRNGKNVTKKMHFAIKGVLSINGDSYNVCLGQGEDGWYNNWHIASEDMVSSSSGKSGDLGNYAMSPKESYHFKVKVK